MSNSVTPPPPMPTPVASQGGAVVVTVSSPLLAGMPRGTPLEARILSVALDGTAQLSATLSDGTAVTAEARLPLTLPEGTVLSLRVAQTADEAATLRLATINGLPLRRVLADPALLLKPTAIVSSVASSSSSLEATAASQMTGAVSTIGVGRPVPALVLRGDVMQDATARGMEDLPPGTRLSVRLTQVSLPDGQGRSMTGGNASSLSAAFGGTPEPSSAAARYAAMGRVAAQTVRSGVFPPGTPGGAASAASGSVSAPAGTPVAAMPSAPLSAGAANAGLHPGQVRPDGSPVSAAEMRPGAPAAPTDGAPRAASAAPSVLDAATSGTGLPKALSGVVISRSALGQPTLRTEAGFIALDVRAPLPNGTQVRFDVLSALPAEAVPTPTLPGVASPWTTLDALMQTLSRTAPEAAAALAARLPQPGPHLLAGLANAMTAVRGGNVDSWLGLTEATRRAEGRDEGRAGKLAEHLAEEVRDGAAATHRPAGEWRAYALPVFVGGAVERIQMLVRRAPGEDDAEGGAHGGARRDDTRFLLDVSLSRLGPMQIDGLVSAAHKSLDVMIRTHAALPAPIPEDLRGIFVATLGAVGYTGSLGFLVTSLFVTPEDAGEAPGGPGLVV